jgi:hypothetical protein
MSHHKNDRGEACGGSQPSEYTTGEGTKYLTIARKIS